MSNDYVDRQHGGRRLYRALVEERAADEESLRNLMSRIFQIKVLDLASSPVDDSLTARFPSQLARQHRVFPLAIEADRLILAAADPTDAAAVEAAKRKTGRGVDCDWPPPRRSITLSTATTDLNS